MEKALRGESQRPQQELRVSRRKGENKETGKEGMIERAGRERADQKRWAPLYTSSSWRWMSWW